MGTNYQGGFAGGVTIQEIPINLMASNKVFWVYSGTGSDGNDGSYDSPFATLDYAVGKCSSNRGDIIILKEGHAETSTTSVIATIDVLGVKVIGLGTGDTRPALTVGSQLVVSVRNVLLKNIRFITNDDGGDYLVDLNGQAVIENCSFEASSTKQPLTFIDITGTAGSCSGTVIRNCEFVSETAGAVAAISLLEVHDSVVVENNDFVGNFSSGCVIGIAGKIATMFRGKGNTFHNTGAGGALVMASCTGTLVGNMAYCAGGATLGYNGASLAYHENYMSSALAIAGLLAKNGAFA